MALVNNQCQALAGWLISPAAYSYMVVVQQASQALGNYWRNGNVRVVHAHVRTHTHTHVLRTRTFVCYVDTHG